jgi:hypothetical protein
LQEYIAQNNAVAEKEKYKWTLLEDEASYYNKLVYGGDVTWTNPEIVDLDSAKQVWTQEGRNYGYANKLHSFNITNSNKEDENGLRVNRASLLNNSTWTDNGLEANGDVS